MSRAVTFRSALCPAAVALAMLAGARASAQNVDPNLWVPNNQVTGTLQSGQTIYICGTFTRVGPMTGGGVPVSATTGAALAAPNIVGRVYAVVPDGSGGWFIGGEIFYAAGVARNGLLHLNSDYTLSSWNPNVSGSVRALALVGNTVYAGGDFFAIGGVTRHRLAAIDATTGLATSWDPNADGIVRALAVDGSTVYVGGAFQNIGGAARSRIAALDMVTGTAKAWDPNASSTVEALAVYNGVVYAGGLFGTIAGQTRNGIAALDQGTGLATSWNPNSLGPPSEFDALAVDAASATLYVGGPFTIISGNARNGLAAIGLSTGAISSWAPSAPGNVVFGITTSGGGPIYVAGRFTTMGGQPRSGIAAIDAVTGLATSWNPDPNGYDAYTVALNGSVAFLGGIFTSIGGVRRTGIAALDATTGAALPWDAQADGAVNDMLLQGNTLYVGGAFLNIGGSARNRIAALDAKTAAATSWNPSATGGGVNTLALDGATMYAGGDFTNIGGQPRNRIAALSTSSGLATAWDPNALATVRDIAVSGGTVYAGGDFTTIGGQPRNRIAALDGAGLATAWNPNASSIVRALLVTPTAIYAGGDFNNIGGQPRNCIAALDGSGLATSWNPNADNSVTGFGLAGNVLYVMGGFNSIGGQFRHRFAAVDATTGTATAWDPNLPYSSFSSGFAYSVSFSGGRALLGYSFTAFGPSPRGCFASVAMLPVLDHITTNHGGNGGRTTAAAVGDFIQTGATVRLTRTGQPDIVGLFPYVTPDNQSIVATYDLTNAALGQWNVVVTNPDLQTATLTNAFTVETGTPYEVRVRIIGPGEARPDRARGFDLVLENLSNNDATNLPLWLTGVPANGTLTLDFQVSAPPNAGQPDWSAAPTTLTGPGGRYAVVAIPRLAPGITVRSVHVSVPNGVTSYTLAASLAPPWLDTGALRVCLLSAGVISDGPCTGTSLTQLDSYMASTGGITSLNGVGIWAKVAYQCQGAAGFTPAVAAAENVLDFMAQSIVAPSPAFGCEVPLRPRWQDRKLVTIVNSLDPNEKLGPGGAGPNHVVGADDLLPYSIRFENVETASAPAQEVVIVDALDPATLDKVTASLGPISFAGRTIYPPPGLSRYATLVDLRPSTNLLVQLSVNLDQPTGVLTWSLASVDPQTGSAPTDPTTGFLPPNVVPPQGEGSMLLTVMPKAGLSSGTQVSNRSTIVFDDVPLQTAPWTNQLDGAAPSSNVLPLPAAMDSSRFTLHWMSNAPSDVHDYSVYVSENNGTYRCWRAHTTATADTFSAAPLKTYKFYSLARDSSGNLELPPAVPDAQTTTNATLLAVEPGPALHLGLEGATPNPSAGDAHVWFTLARSAPAMLELVDVSGRCMMKREVGALGAGRHAVNFGPAARHPGIYFVSLTQDGHTLRNRIVVLR